MGEKLLVKGLTIVAAGVCVFKVFEAVRYYKLQKELYEEIEESAKYEK